MPTRSVNQPIISTNNNNNNNNNNNDNISYQTNNYNAEQTSYIGKILTINQHQVIVDDVLGQGGFALVFLVRSLTNQQRYALKRMYVNNERDLTVCQREIAILKEFSNQTNIVKYIDSSIQRLSPTNSTKKRENNKNNDDDDDRDDDDEDDVIYEILLLTEYCSNGSLINRLNEQRQNGISLTERQILRIFADLCQAVSCLHFRRPQPILHRDIKLENILLDSHQSIVLCDFGSAIYLTISNQNHNYQQYQTEQLTTKMIQQIEEDIQRYTTLSYRAPEFIDLYSRLSITLKVDIWAMGCLLYKLMYNQMPFGDSILAIQNGTFVLPDDMSQIYSKELNLLLRYILEIDIQKRPDIWQVSYLTYKLLGMECPIVNRFHSKQPDLSTLTVPLTESESRHQRALALANAKSSSSTTTTTSAANVSDESTSIGTAVNPRERPRGIAAPPGSLINFAQSTQQKTTVVPPPPTNVSLQSNQQRTGSTAQSLFDDDFSQLSLTNIPNPHVLTPKADSNVSRARPSPPSVLQPQQLFPPPPPSSMQTNSSHRRSASQTMSPPATTTTNNPSYFPPVSSTESNSTHERRHSIDSSVKQEILFIGDASSDDDEDARALESNLNKLKIYNHSTENVKSRESLILNEDDRLFAKTYTINSQLKSDDEQSSSSISDDNTNETNQKTKKKVQSALTPLRTNDETEKVTSSPSTTNKNLVQRLIERCSLQQSDDSTLTSTPYKRKDSLTLSNENPILIGDHSDDDSDSDSDYDNQNSNYNHDNHHTAGFDQLINEDSDNDEENASINRVNTTKSNVTSSLFTSSRHKEQQYENFQDSDDDDDENSTNSSTINKTSSNPTTKLFNLFSTNSKTHPSNDCRRLFNEHNNQTNISSSSSTNNDNPFLHAPFHYTHRSPTQKQPTQQTTTSNTTFDPTSIVVGKRLSAFAPYHRQELASVDSNTNKSKIPHSESYPPGINNNNNTNNNVNSTNQSTISKDVFTNAPFKNKVSSKPQQLQQQQQQQQQQSTNTSKFNAVSPSSSHSTSSSNSQLIDFTITSSQPNNELIIRSPPLRRHVGSAGLATHFSTLTSTNTTNDTYYFHSDRHGNDGHSSSEELTSSSSSSRKRTNKKKSFNQISTSSGNDSQQHAYANLSFNDAIVDELL